MTDDEICRQVAMLVADLKVLAERIQPDDVWHSLVRGNLALACGVLTEVEPARNASKVLRTIRSVSAVLRGRPCPECNE